MDRSSAERCEKGKRGQMHLAGTARRLLRTRRTCPPFPRWSSPPTKNLVQGVALVVIVSLVERSHIPELRQLQQMGENAILDVRIYKRNECQALQASGPLQVTHRRACEQLERAQRAESADWIVASYTLGFLDVQVPHACGARLQRAERFKLRHVGDFQAPQVFESLKPRERCNTGLRD